MFSELSDFLEENEFFVKQSLISHLHVRSQWFDKYFPEGTSTTPVDHPWAFTIPNTHHLSSDLIEALDYLWSDCGWKISFDTKRTQLWLNFGYQLQKKIHKYLICVCNKFFTIWNYLHLWKGVFWIVIWISGFLMYDTSKRYRSWLEVDLRVPSLKLNLKLICCILNTEPIILTIQKKYNHLLFMC